MVRGLVIITFLLLSMLSHAQQIAFKREHTPENVNYLYRWLDYNGTEQALQFALENQQLAKTPNLQRIFQPALAQRYVTVALLKEAREIDPKSARINIVPRNEAIEVKVRARSQQQAEIIQQQLQRRREEAYQEYLREHYYTQFVTPRNEQAVKPDHVRYVLETTDALIPLSQAFYEKLEEDSDAREYFNLLLSWIQSIPYDTLEDRTGSNGSGFSPPAQVLSQNKGDCDSKTVITAAIVRAFLPTTAMVMVLLPEHALLGVALPPKGNELTVMDRGTTYILMEPTGPALLPFGQVAPTTYQFLANGEYTLERIQ
ncbi:hypothetical protein OPS25_12590 [Alteromonas ponticola]|uniref:Transglutaminase domain-containing protein n=1 Tax=Alteromonas aquimaris TaxID=2998417 RepID=A0ABT3P9F1_9ALTE|nr:hypothetical protein [Alteromonas aquimaris]MCW8109339.1 hypothetical protein [Alteromonas aquimaris]